jgi:hypothetical protein
LDQNILDTRDRSTFVPPISRGSECNPNNLKWAHINFQVAHMAGVFQNLEDSTMWAAEGLDVKDT